MVVLTQSHWWHWHIVPHAHSEWLCPHTSMSPGPPALQDTDSWQQDVEFYLNYYKGHNLALWSWLCGSRWIREAPRHSSRCGFGGAGCSPHWITEQFGLGPSADHPVPTPSEGRDAFHKTFQQTRLLQTMSKALGPCKASRYCVPEAGGCGRCPGSRTARAAPRALQAHEVSALALHKCTLMYKYDQSFILVGFPTNKSHKWISITGQ